MDKKSKEDLFIENLSKNLDKFILILLFISFVITGLYLNTLL